jgi:hypothetical protein
MGDGAMADDVAAAVLTAEGALCLLPEGIAAYDPVPNRPPPPPGISLICRDIVVCGC